MATSASDVAAVLRERLPGVGAKKLHKLLYYCQGHHLAAFGAPLFAESVSAWDMGPVVGRLWRDEKVATAPPARRELSEAELNTVGYVLSRYGALTGRDLENLTHGEEPWRRADAGREPGGTARIEQEWLTQFFRTAGPESDEDAVPLDPGAVARWLAGAAGRLAEPVRRDSPEELRARLSQDA